MRLYGSETLYEIRTIYQYGCWHITPQKNENAHGFGVSWMVGRLTAMGGMACSIANGKLPLALTGKAFLPNHSTPDCAPSLPFARPLSQRRASGCFGRLA